MEIYDIKEKIIDAYELPCYDSRKSFYGKATVIETEKGRYLKSYRTIICFLPYGGEIKKLWDGYSMTTQRHIKSFLYHAGIMKGRTKKEWDEIPCEEYE